MKASLKRDSLSKSSSIKTEIIKFYDFFSLSKLLSKYEYVFSLLSEQLNPSVFLKSVWNWDIQEQPNAQTQQQLYHSIAEEEKHDSVSLLQWHSQSPDLRQIKHWDGALR